MSYSSSNLTVSSNGPPLGSALEAEVRGLKSTTKDGFTAKTESSSKYFDVRSKTASARTKFQYRFRRRDSRKTGGQTLSDQSLVSFGGHKKTVNARRGSVD